MGWLKAFVLALLLFSAVGPWSCPSCGTENALADCPKCFLPRPSSSAAVPVSSAAVPVIMATAGLVASSLLPSTTVRHANQPVVFVDKYSRTDTVLGASVAEQESSDADLWISFVLPTLPDPNAAWLNYSIRFDGDQSRQWSTSEDFVTYWRPRHASWLDRSEEVNTGRTNGTVTTNRWTPKQILGLESKERRKNTRQTLSTFRKKTKQRFDKQVTLVDSMAFKSDQGADALARTVRLNGKSIIFADGRYGIKPISSAPIYYGFTAVAQSSSKARKRARDDDDGGRWIVKDGNGVHVVLQDPGEEVQ
jgi:hypothetical protein